MSRRKSAPLKPKTVITSIVVCSSICLAGIGYVWAKTQVLSLGRERKQLELRRDELKRINDSLERTYAAMCTPRELDARAKRLNLGLAAPQPDQIIRRPEPTPLAQRQAETKIYASGGPD